MRASLIENVFTIAATPDALLAQLSEPVNYIGLSPLVVAVEEVRTVADTVHYVAVERFRLLGFLRHDNRIAVTLRSARVSAANSAVWGEVVSQGGVRLDYRYAFAADGQRTTMTDTLRLRAPFGLRRFACSQARSVQLSRARILAQRLACDE